jgi:hypothetical protein
VTVHKLGLRTLVKAVELSGDSRVSKFRGGARGAIEVVAERTFVFTEYFFSCTVLFFQSFLKRTS